MTIWFTSDEHYGHANVIRFCNRPFADTEEMQEGLIARHNEVVKSEDEVIHLGDFAWREQLTEPILKRLNGSHHLVMGNHDKCHPIHKKWKKARERYLGYGFLTVEERRVLNVAGNNITLCHLPYRPTDPHDDVRYIQQRPVDRGGWLICGHVHERWQIKDRMINVGVDAWNLYPISLEKIMEIIA